MLGLQGSASLVDRGELNVAEALGAARIRVSGQTDALDRSVLGEELLDHVLVGGEGDVADEQGVTLGAGLVAEGLGAVVSTLTRVCVAVGTGVGVVEVHLAAVELGVLLSSMSLDGVLDIDEFDISESDRLC